MRKRTSVLCLFLVCFLTACSGGNSGTQPEGSMMRDYVAEYRNQRTINPEKSTWKAEEVEVAETFFSVEKYLSPVFHNAEGRNWDIGSVVCGDIYAQMYMKDYYGGEEAEDFTYYVDKLNVNTLETESVSFTFAKGEAKPYAFDYAGDSYYGLFEHFDENRIVDRVSITVMLSDGSVGESIDITAVLKEQGLLTENAHYSFQGKFHVNEELGLIYLVPYEKNGLYVLGTDGTLQHQYVNENSSISFWSNTASGDSLFTEYDTANGEIIFFCFSEGKIKKLFTQKGIVPELASLDSYGNILYLENKTNLVTWNISTGKQERIVRGVGDVIGELAAVMYNNEGKVMVLREDCYGLSMNVYSPNGPAVQAELTIETTEGWGLGLPEVLGKFEQTHPGITIRCGTEATDTAAQNNRINQLYSDISGGNGPDLVYLPYFQVDTFLEREALISLNEAVEREKDKILPGFLEIGQFEGAQYYFPLQFFNETVVVKRSEWGSSTWTVSQVLELLQQKKAVNPDYLLFDGESSTYRNLLQFFVNDIANGPFIDRNTMTAAFDGELFKQVLECCKEQGELAARRAKEGEMCDSSVEGMIRGEQLAMFCLPMFNLFSQTVADLEEDYNCVGYPTERSSGNFVLGNYGFVINRNTENAEIIMELLQYLYSDEACKSNRSGVPFRKDALVGRIVENPSWAAEPGVYMEFTYRGYSRINGTKKDGSSFLEEYLEYLDSLIPAEISYDEIKYIIFEEAEFYFNGDKTVEQVQQIIQNRASLYLDELR